MRKDGIDPIDKRKAERTARNLEFGKIKTFDEVAAQCLDRYKKKWTPRYWENARRWLEVWVSPKWGNLPINIIDVGMVKTLLTPIQEKHDGRGGTPTANGVRIIIKQVIDYAVAHEYREPGENPASNAGALPILMPDSDHEVDNHPALPIDQMGAFMKVLREHKDRRGWHGRADFVGRGRLLTTYALELCILTGVRQHQVQEMKWADVDPVKKLWTCKRHKVHKNKKADHEVVMSDAAMAVLAAVKAQEGVTGEYVFPGDSRSLHSARGSLNAFIKRVFPEWKDENGKTIHVHGFRTTFKSWAREHGFNEEAELQLGHFKGNVEEIYARLAKLLSKRRAMMEAWAAHCYRPEPLPAVVRDLGEARKKRA